MTDSVQPVPEGFVPYPAISPFMALFGPMYLRSEPDATSSIGLRLALEHQNHQGTAHGGMLASVADNALGFNVARAMGSAIATVHLSIDYLGRSAVGDWLEVRTVIDKRGGRICFAQCTGHSQGAAVFKASGIFSAIASPERA